jgi:predicted Fe-S protein YdhL (DUF1289 family)
MGGWLENLSKIVIIDRVPRPPVWRPTSKHPERERDQTVTEFDTSNDTAAGGAADRRARRRERKRRAQKRAFDTTVPSPCIAVCQVDSATDLCLGCRRHVDEIRDWPIMTAAEKRAAWTRIDARAAADLPAGATGSGGAGTP